MAINVICPGCMKRFKVSERFAGQKGPCPNCNTVIDIPKASIKIHGAEDFEQGGRSATGKLLLKPISRLVEDFDPVRAGIAAAGVVVVFLLALILGKMNLSLGTRDVIGLIGLVLIAFPISLFGYQVLRDREELFVLAGLDLYKQAGYCAGIYVALWFLFEIILWYTGAGQWAVWIYFIPIACLGMLATHAILDINVGNALLHYLIFAVTVIFLRGLMSLGWLWQATESLRQGGAGPAPML